MNRRNRVALALLAAAAAVAPFTASGAAAEPAPRPTGAPDPDVTRLFGGQPALKLPAWTESQRTAERKRRATGAEATLLPGLSLPPFEPAPATAATSALVLYDNAGPFGHLGELYAMATANLAGRFGSVTTMPVSKYTAGAVDRHTATIYIGSTYYGGEVPDAVPDAFYADVVRTARPVVWMNNNIWNLAAKAGAPAFSAKYGWDPVNSFFGPAGAVRQVDYKGQPLTRTVPASLDAGVLRPAVTDAAKVTTLARGDDGQPWAIRSANLTYLGEIPYSYTRETDRIIVWHDLLFDALAPDTPTRRRAILRLEDISPKSDPEQLMTIARYLDSQNIPYAFQVVPVYTDPNGAYNDGRPQTIQLAQRPKVVQALRYMLANGGRIVAHGYTHQYKSARNPYTGTTGDDFEFFRAHVDEATDSVVLDGPVAEDSALWAANRLTQGKLAYTLAGLPTPQIWTTPHYAASATDYGAIKLQYQARLERSLYFSGQLEDGPVDGRRFIGQFFPYPVRDVNGAKVLPENLGNYEPEAQNNHPARQPADIVRAARANLAVRDGYASFFYHPYYPVRPLQEIVEGIRGLGYTFVDPVTVIP